MNKQAFLPEHLEESNLSDLVDGETVYVVPWCMYAEKDGSLWLNGNYTFYRSPRDTAVMRVTKRNSCYIVNTRLCKSHKWSRDGDGFVGNFTPIPVSKIE